MQLHWYSAELVVVAVASCGLWVFFRIFLSVFRVLEFYVVQVVLYCLFLFSPARVMVALLCCVLSCSCSCSLVLVFVSLWRRGRFWLVLVLLVPNFFFRVVLALCLVFDRFLASSLGFLVFFEPICAGFLTS